MKYFQSVFAGILSPTNTAFNDQLKRLENKKQSYLSLSSSSISEKNLLKLLKDVFRYPTDITANILILDISGLCFSERHNAKFPRLLKYFKRLNYLYIFKEGPHQDYCTTFLPDFYIAIKEDKFKRKEKLMLTFKFNSCKIMKSLRSQYILALLMTSFAHSETCASLSTGSEFYKYHFILCEQASRSRKDVKYSISECCYNIVPREYKSFCQAHGVNLTR